jgi:hypothetical protein
MNTKSKPHLIQAVFYTRRALSSRPPLAGLLVSALASRSGGVTIIAALSLVMGPLGPLVGAIWLRRTRKPWFWINLDREAQITPDRPTDFNVKLRIQRFLVIVETASKLGYA